MSDADDIQSANASVQNRWVTESIPTLSNVIWEQLSESDTTWEARCIGTTELVGTFVSNDYALEFYKRQLALAIFDVNRMEGTIAPTLETGATFAKIIENLEYDNVIPDPIEWDAEGGREQSVQSSDRQLYQTARAAKFLLEQNKNADLSLDLLVATYQLLMENSYSEDKKGHRTYLVVNRVREGKEEVYADSHQFVSASDVKQLVHNLCNKYNRTRLSMHPIDAATFLFYEMITIHPFSNGNGRMCRLLLAWSLLKDGFPFPVSFTSGRRRERLHYIYAIEAARRLDTGHRGQLNTMLLVSIERVYSNYLTNNRLHQSLKGEDICVEV